MNTSYRKKVGDYLIVYILEVSRMMIAEITNEDPLVVKTGEREEYVDLTEDEFEFLLEETIQFQNDDTRVGFLKKQKMAGKAVASGLRSLGIIDNEFYEILPADKNLN